MSFEKKAQTWDNSKRRQQLADAIAQAIKERIPLDRSMRFLDVGAGTGLLYERMAPLLGDGVACDTSEKMLQKLRIKQPKAQCQLIDICSFSDPKGFNLIVSSMTLHHILDTAALFERLWQLLRPGGWIALADLAKEDGTFHDEGNKGVFHFGFDPSMLINMAKTIDFRQCNYHIIHRIQKSPSRHYEIFLLTAHKPA